MKSFYLFCTLLLCNCILYGQSLPYNILFDDEKVNSIYITIDPDSLEEMLDELENEYEYPVTFVYSSETENDTLQNVGFRLRGNTSLSSAKKSYKISFNTYEPGRKYHDVEKLNIIGNHNDASMSREKLYFDIYNAFGLPVRRVSFVKLFVNEEYYGLYTNVEEYDEIFLKERFGENTGNLFKCLYGSNLQYNGTSTSAYSSYELQTNEEAHDYSDLIDFIYILNNTPIENLPCELEKVFNVDNFLKIYAIDIATGHWDNYGANQNNFYLYHNQFTGQFEFLSYDCDNVLGIDWLGIDWAERDMYDWNFDNRPLVEKLMQVEEYRNRFSYYCNELLNTFLLPENFFPHIDSLKELITPAALDDDFKGYDWGYTDDDFLNSFNTDNLDDHTPYGIKNFIETRNTETILQVELTDIFPVAVKISPALLIDNPHDTAQFILQCTDDGWISDVSISSNIDGDASVTIPMFDDGMHGDENASDNIFGFVFDDLEGSSFIDYHFEVTDNTGNVTLYPPCGDFYVALGYTPPSLAVNELLAINDTVIADNAGDYDDYIEIYNTGSASVYLGNYYLSDDFSNPSKWRLPDVHLASDAYIIFWADDETAESEEHCDFKLSGDGEQLGLFAGVTENFSVIDTISFGAQTADISFGRLPNGTGDFVLLPKPSPGKNNEENAPPSDTSSFYTFTIMSNPLQETSAIQLQLTANAYISIDIFSLNGQLVFPVFENQLTAGTYYYPLPNEQLAGGLYFIRLTVNGEQSTYTLMQV